MTGNIRDEKEDKMAKFGESLLRIASRETSSNPEGWVKENPLYGHCAVVSVIAQNLFGGNLLRTSLKGTEFEDMGSHYINEIDGRMIDFTKSQFGDSYESLQQKFNFEPRTREYVLFDAEGKPRPIMERYKSLAFKVMRISYGENKIFEDPIYKIIFNQAMESKCQKMWFGSVITRGTEVVYAGYNKTIEPLKGMCTPKCIRLDIQSRTESMLGACGHAEEQGLWEVARKGIDLRETELYVAGFYTNGMPYMKTEPVHTCLRCSVQMYNAQIKTIYVPVVDHWEGISTKQALDTAALYATKQKNV
jgi:deoxycytidylate deaminase